MKGKGEEKLECALHTHTEYIQTANKHTKKMHKGKQITITMDTQENGYGGKVR